MALTCRDLSELSLDRLWRVMRSFEPLIACLPSDLFIIERPADWTQTGKPWLVQLRRPLVPSDLERYRGYYARRIREFILDVSKSPMKLLSADVLEALRTATDGEHGALSPLLKSCAWLLRGDVGHAFHSGPHAEASRRFFPYMFIWMGPSVENLRLTVGWDVTPTAASIMQATSRWLPNLKKLTFEEYSFSTFSRHPEIAAFPWRNIQHFKASSVPPSSIPHLASLPYLTNLTFTNMMEIPMQYRPCDHPHLKPETSHLMPSEGFPSLKYLTISTGKMQTCIAFLQHLPPNNVVRGVICESEGSLSVSDAQGILDTVRNHLNTASLEMLFIRDSKMTDSLRQFYEEFGPNEWTEQWEEEPFQGEVDMHALFEFTKLRGLQLSFAVRPRITPAEVDMIVKSWPMIQTLDLCESAPVAQLPLINHTHLLRLASECDYLRDIGVSFDGTRIIGKEKGRVGLSLRG
ncbi:hypothetical protein NMY22_g12674 [Coprinellus aureogranulatus]|nr:hypothetical protein NMY22_g12674 [Coprinellus aureogranulatus]